jgi:hypothetical protein
VVVEALVLARGAEGGEREPQAPLRVLGLPLLELHDPALRERADPVAGGEVGELGEAVERRARVGELVEVVLALGDPERRLDRVGPLVLPLERAEALEREAPLVLPLEGKPRVEERGRLVARAREEVGEPRERGGGPPVVGGAVRGGADREQLLVVLPGELEVEPRDLHVVGRELEARREVG